MITHKWAKWKHGSSVELGFQDNTFPPFPALFLCDHVSLPWEVLPYKTTFMQGIC